MKPLHPPGIILLCDGVIGAVAEMRYHDALFVEGTLDPMGPVPNDLGRLQEQLGELLAELSIHGGESPASTDENPAHLIGAFGQLFEVMARMESDTIRNPGARTPEQMHSITELGEFAFNLLDKSAHLLPSDDPARIEQLALLNIGFAHWVVRHAGEVQHLERIVDELAMLANHSDSTMALAELARVMLDIIDNAGPRYRQDLESSNPGRPWRLLHLNLGIVATRARRADLMEQAFDRLVRHLPQDASQFFHQGMQQIQLGDYPESVRTVMGRYFQHWGGKPALH